MNKNNALCLIFISLIGIGMLAGAAQKAEVIPKWDVSDETNTGVIDHALWHFWMPT